MKSIDVFIAARPDQSLQIYYALRAQQGICYKYLTFKVLPFWLKKLFGLRKVNGVGRGARISFIGTIKHLFIRKYKFGFARNWTDRDILDNLNAKILHNNTPRIIHYWPDNCGSLIPIYAQNHPDVFVIADIHMPHPQVVFQEMQSIYNDFSLEYKDTELSRLIEEQKDYVTEVSNILVPSSYVADTYRALYPEKNYYVVSYGLTIRDSFKAEHKMIIKDFVYIGSVSLEKGSDLLLRVFESHPELNLHIFGIPVDGQKHLFEKYYNLKNIIFHGFVPKTEIQTNVAKYDAGIHLSRFDAYSLAVGEIIGTGKPVIVSNKTGNADDVEQNAFGIVTSLNIDDIELAISQMCDSNNYNYYVDNIENYIINKNVSYGDKMIDFYNSLLNK